MVVSKAVRKRTLFGISLSLFLAACGSGGSSTPVSGGDSSGVTPPPIADGDNVRPEDSFIMHRISQYKGRGECTEGGVLFEAGNDVSENSMLERLEIDEAKLICNNTIIEKGGSFQQISFDEINDPRVCPENGYEVTISAAKYTVCHVNGGARLVPDDSSESLVSAVYSGRVVAEELEDYSLGVNTKEKYILDAYHDWFDLENDEHISSNHWHSVRAPMAVDKQRFQVVVSGDFFRNINEQRFDLDVDVVSENNDHPVGVVKFDNSEVEYPGELGVVLGVSGPYSGAMFLGANIYDAARVTGYAHELMLSSQTAREALDEYISRLEFRGVAKFHSMDIDEGKIDSGVVVGRARVSTEIDFKPTELTNTFFVTGLSTTGRTYSYLTEVGSGEHSENEFDFYISVKDLGAKKFIVVAGVIASDDASGWGDVLSRLTKGDNITNK